MSGGHKNADQLKEAVVLRSGGYSLAAIASKTGISCSTLQRHFKRLGTPKGALNAEAVEQAKQELLSDAGFVDSVKSQIAAVITDDLAHFVAIREAAALTLEALMCDSSLPPHYRARGITALATTLSVSQAVARKALAIDDQPPEQESVPVLTVSELSVEEIAEMHRKQRELEEATAIGESYVDTETNDVIEEVME